MSCTHGGGCAGKKKMSGGCPSSSTVVKIPGKGKLPGGLPCPICKGSETKFRYYNNTNIMQPRYECMECGKYWTEGGSIRGQDKKEVGLQKSAKGKVEISVNVKIPVKVETPVVADQKLQPPTRAMKAPASRTSQGPALQAPALPTSQAQSRQPVVPLRFNLLDVVAVASSDYEETGDPSKDGIRALIASRLD